MAWSWQPRGEQPLLLAANRDEWLHRPAQPMHWWDLESAGGVPLLAGRDLLGAGTWLGLRRDGRFAALTNVREADPRSADRPSRGRLPLRFLQGRHPHEAAAWSEPGVHAWADELRRHMHAYAGFNLLLADLRRGEMVWLSNRADPAAGVVDVAPGVHGLSNAALDTPWPKVQRLKQGVARLCQPAARPEAPDTGFETLLGLLGDAEPAPDEHLPELPEGMTLSMTWQRALSAPFIRLPDYGTRCSTLLRADADGSLHVLELQRDAGAERREFRWNWRD